jgi:cation diffusion facilitator family transporter
LLRYQQARRVTLLSGAANFALAVTKIIAGTVGHSHALIADGIHSFSDLLSDALVLLASRFGSLDADHNHPYGHARIETAATVLLAQILVLAGAAIIYDATRHLLVGNSVKPSSIVLVIAVLSIIVNEGLFHYIKRCAKRLKSKLLYAHAWHQRSDALASIVVLIGVLGTWLGWRQLDIIAALVVGVMVVKMSITLGWSSIRELVDTGLDDAKLQALQKQILTVPGVKAVHQLRTRSMAGAILLDVHIIVDPYLSVSEGHYIAQQVHFHLIQQQPNITDVTVHIDPEDDEVVAPARDLPARAQLQPKLIQCWQGLPGADKLTMPIWHYLNGKIKIEIRLPYQMLEDKLDQESSLANLQQQYQSAIKDFTEIDGVKIYLY